MKILIFSAFDGVPCTDETPMRYAAIADEFLKNGHEVMYVSAAFSHIHKKYRKITDTPPHLRIILLATKHYKSNFSIDRALSHYHLSFTLSDWLSKLNPSNYPDLVLGASPPIFANYVLASFCKKKNIPFYYDLQDLWPEEFVRFLPGKANLKFLLKPYFSSAEKVIKMASGVTSVSKDYLDYYHSILPAKSKVFYLGADVEKFDGAAKTSSNDAKYKIMMLGNSQAGNFVMTAARAIQPLHDVSLVIAGLKERTVKYQQKIHGENLLRVQVLEWIDPNEIYKILPGFNVGLILTNPDSKSAFPNRAFTYFAAGLPVINNIMGGELEQLVQTHHLGLSISIQEPADLAKAIEFCRYNYNFEDHRRIRQFALGNFSRNDIYREFYNWIMDNFVKQTVQQNEMKKNE